MHRDFALSLCLLATLALGGCGDDSSAGDGGDGSSCASGLTSCGGGCVNVSVDINNCGGCGNICGIAESCSSGTCQPMTDCPDGMADCGRGCIDVTSDDMNCSTCGRSCGDGENCIEGTCTTATCTSAEMRCGAACVDVMTDDANCGSCGNECPTGQSCASGSCSDACVAPRMLCGMDADEVCVDVMTDASNCGSCGNACDAGEECTGGSCGCPAGQDVCDGSCVDTDTDVAHCGGCGMPCGTDQICVSGACTCPTPSMLCGGTCTLTNIDSANCGSCDNVCPSGTPTCVSGTCMSSACTSGEIPCGGGCVDPQNDDDNCGGCGMTCGAGTMCSTGRCRPMNDPRSGAIEVTLDDAEVMVSGSTADATKDGPTSGTECIGCTGGGNVWYSLTLPESGALYVDSQGSSFDTKLFLTNESGAMVTEDTGEVWCQDDHSCGSAPDWGMRDARLYGWLTAGTYLLSVGGCTTGDFTLHIQFVGRGVASFVYSAPLEGDAVTDSTALIGSSVTAGTCGGASSGEDARWFVTCGGQPQTFSLCRSDYVGFFFRTHPEYERTNGMVNYDPRMYARSAQTGMQVSCNDDGASMGATDCLGYDSTMGTSSVVDGFEYGSRLDAIVFPRGLGVVFVDSSSGGSGMDYRLLHRVKDAP